MAGRVRVTITLDRFPQIAAKLPEETRKVVKETALAVESRMKVEMGKSKHGEAYGPHRASAPGEAPAVDTGALINDLLTRFMDGGLRAQVESHMEYAPHLEYGTVKMGARPFMTPAAEGERGEFNRKMRELLKRL